MSAPQPNVSDTFYQAACAYRERHQACINCGQSHCVFRFEVGELTEYRCFQCGFFVGHLSHRGKYLMGQDDPGVVTFEDDQPDLLQRPEEHPLLRVG